MHQVQQESLREKVEETHQQDQVKLLRHHQKKNKVNFLFCTIL